MKTIKTIISYPIRILGIIFTAIGLSLMFVASVFKNGLDDTEKRLTEINSRLS